MLKVKVAVYEGIEWERNTKKGMGNMKVRNVTIALLLLSSIEARFNIGIKLETQEIGKKLCLVLYILYYLLQVRTGNIIRKQKMDMLNVKSERYNNWKVKITTGFSFYYCYYNYTNAKHLL